MMPPYCSVSYSFVRRWGNLNLRIWQKTDGKCAIWCHNLKCKVSIYVCVILFNFIDSRKKKIEEVWSFAKKRKKEKRREVQQNHGLEKLACTIKSFGFLPPQGAFNERAPHYVYHTLWVFSSDSLHPASITSNFQFNTSHL